MIKTITFDLDDTLWPLKPTLDYAEQHTYDWLDAHAPALTSLYSLEKLRTKRAELIAKQPELHHQISKIRTITIYQALLNADYPPIEAAAIEKQAFEVFLTARHKVKLFEHSEHLLKELFGNYQLGVLTNGNADIYKLDIGKYFNFAFRAEELNASKPSTDHFEAAMTSANCKAEEIIHIGDSIKHDVLGALKAGCHAVWFNPNKEEKPEGLKETYHEIYCLLELPELIEKIKQDR